MAVVRSGLWDPDLKILLHFPVVETGSALGMESLAIQDSQITVSASNISHEPSKGRLNSPLGGAGWCASYDPALYLQIDLQTTHIITAVNSYDTLYRNKILIIL